MTLKLSFVEETFQKQKGIISLVSFGTFANRIMSQDQPLNPRPIDNGVDQFHSFDGSIMFQRRKQGDIGEGKIG